MKRCAMQIIGVLATVLLVTPAVAKKPINGICGSAEGVATSTSPTSGLCSSGSATSVSGGSSLWTWSCIGSGPHHTNASCSAPDQVAVVNGACGPANGGSFSTAPTTGLCIAGMATPVSGGNGSNWTWGCDGSNGGGNASCSAIFVSSTGNFIWQTEYDVVDKVNVNGNPYVPELDTTKTWPPIEFATNVDTSTGALGDLWQFDVHAGDVSNIGSERAELDGYPFTIPRDTEFWISYAIKILPGDVIPFATTSFNILGQSHQGAASGHPDFYCWYLDDKFYFNVGNTSAPNANVDGQNDGTYYISAVLPRNVWHYVVYDVIKSSSGVGDKLLVWFDGVLIYAEGNATLMGEHTSGSYWKYGIYRAPGSSTPLPIEIVQFANVEVSTSSLDSRIATPLPTPTPK